MAMLLIITTSGNKPSIHILEHYASSILKQGLLKNKIKYRLVTPHLHRSNVARHSIKTFKAKFITCLWGTYPKCPSKEWYRFLPQATLNLNPFRNCWFTFLKSAYKALCCIFDYTKTLLSPLVTIFLVHNKTNNSCTWAPHDTDGCYIRPYLEDNLWVE